MLRLLACFVCVASLVAPAFAAEVPRPAPEITFSLPNGQKVSLDDYKGKIVAVEIMLTTCPGCQHTSTVLQKLYAEYGPKGFQPLGIAINDEDGRLVTAYVRDLKITFPIGYAPRDVAIGLLQHSMMMTLMVPQLLIIDRDGVIQAQFAGMDDFFRNDEANMRRLLDSMLEE